MAKRRSSGEGNIRKRSDGRWEGRYVAGHDANGKPIRKNVLGKTQAEVKEKLKKALDESHMIDVGKAEDYTVESGCGRGMRSTQSRTSAKLHRNGTGIIYSITSYRKSVISNSPS